MRPQILGNYDGSNGLRLKDLPELDIENLAFTQTPARVNVSRELSKINKPFFTFIGEEACAYVLVYLRKRRKQGEHLDGESPVIRPDNGAPRFCLRNNICDTIRRAMRSINQPQRIYIWRSYFANRCMMAESKGFLASWRNFFMGHTGDIQTRYGLRKQLQDGVVDEMRAGYGRALPFLETLRMVVDDPLPEFLGAMLRVDGASEEDIVRMELACRSRDEQVRAVREMLAAMPARQAGPVFAQGEARQKIVGLDAVESLLGDGWLYKATLPDG